MELVNFTCKWPSSQLDPPLVPWLCRLVVIHSMASYVLYWSQVTLEIFISWKLLSSDTGNSRRSHPGHRSVTHWSQSITMYHSGQAVVVVLGPKFMPIDLQMACESHNLISLSWCGHKSLLSLGQLYTLCLLVCQSLPDIDVNTSLWSDDKSLMTAHESKKSRIFQLVNRS